MGQGWRDGSVNLSTIKIKSMIKIRIWNRHFAGEEL